MQSVRHLSCQSPRQHVHSGPIVLTNSSRLLSQSVRCSAARRLQQQQRHDVSRNPRTSLFTSSLQQHQQLPPRLLKPWQRRPQYTPQHLRVLSPIAAATADNPQQDTPQQDLAQSLTADEDDQSDLQHHINLPPSRSTALWLQDLTDTQLQQRASDWGYLQVGRSLPEGVSLNAIADTIPDEHFQLDLVKAVGYLALSIGVMALGYSYLWYWHSICSIGQQVLCWIVIGTGYFGVFQSAVDCAHFAFWPSRPLVQDLLGATLMAPALVSYEIWRLKYFNHLMCLNQLYEDTDAWHPLLPADLADLPPWRLALLRLLSATPLKFFSSIGQWFKALEGFDLKLHPPQTRPWVWLSWALPLGFCGVVWPAMIAAGGVGGWVSWWLGPWIMFHGWLSVLSLVQHTGPHITWTTEGLTYDSAQAAINGTATLQLPKWLEVLLHHANYHLPAHVSISIPSYNLKGAQNYLQQRLGKYLTIADLNWQLPRNLMTAWLVYDEQRQRYVDFDEAEELVQQYKQQRQQQQQQTNSDAGSSGGGSGGSNIGGAGGRGPAAAAAEASGNGAQPRTSEGWQQQAAAQPQSSSPAAAYGS